MQHCVDGEELAHGTRKQKQVVIESLKVYGKIKTLQTLLLRTSLIMTSGSIMVCVLMGTTSKGYHKRLRKYTGQLRCCNMIPQTPDQVRIKPDAARKESPDGGSACRNVNLKALNDKLTVFATFSYSHHTGLAYCDVMDFDFYTMTVKNGKIY